VPEHREQDVLRGSELARRVERIDQDEAVARLERKRADVLLPLLVPRRPAAESRCELLDAETVLVAGALGDDHAMCARTPIQTATASATMTRSVRM
jgi:hypothetical protein